MSGDLLTSELQQIDEIFADQMKNKPFGKVDIAGYLFEPNELKKALKDATTESWNDAINAGFFPDGHHGFKLPDDKR